MGGLIGVVVQPSMEKFIEDVREGTLDFTLTKPEEAQVLVSVGQVRVWRLLDVVAGPVIIAAALYHLGRGVGPEAAVKFGVALSAGSVIMYSFWLILATISFWFIRIENILMIFQNMYDAARWPVTIYPGWLRAALTFLVPVTFAVTVPAQALVGRLTADFLIGHPGTCPGFARRLAAVLENRGAPLFRRLGVRGGFGVPPRLRYQNLTLRQPLQPAFKGSSREPRGERKKPNGNDYRVLEHWREEEALE